jgi:hypothetical protein
VNKDHFEKLLAMEVGEQIELKVNGMEYSILCVYTGWIYTTCYNATKVATSVFVPAKLV